VHVDPPTEHKAYLHRSGRTARAGAGGTVVTLSTPDQHGEVRTLTRQAGITPIVSQVRPGAEQITALTGPAAPYVEPAPAPEPQPQGQGGGRRRRGGSGGATTGTPAAKPAAGGRGGSRTAGPARTRAELAARAGTHSPASFSGRSRRGGR
jgi:superfamily II DNA/RNA helicase